MAYGQELSHAYIIAGEAEAAYAEARELAAAMLCQAPGRRPCGLCRHCVKVKNGTHPDVITVERLSDDKGKTRREIYVDQIREISQSAHILPNEAEKKVYIIRDAGTMNPNAQNALLKLLEEPPRFVAFVLAADNAGQLLETVRSRCVLRTLPSGEEAPSPEMRELAETYLNCAAAGRRTALLSFCNARAEMSTAEAAEFVLAVRALLTDMLCSRLPDRGLGRRDLLRLAALMAQAEEYLRFNVGVKHVFGMLSADTIRPSGDSAPRNRK